MRDAPGWLMLAFLLFVVLIVAGLVWLALAAFFTLGHPPQPPA